MSEKFELNGVTYTKEDLMKMAERDQKAKDRAKVHAERLRAKNKIILQKAKEAGIDASKEEIDKEIAEMEKRAKK